MYVLNLDKRYIVDMFFLFSVEQMKSKILERVESVTSDTGATSGEEGKARKRY